MRKGLGLVPVRQQIFEGIKEMILTNTVAPGEIISIERLAEGFGVSPTPIREALIRLEGFSLVTLVPNRGARVTEISACDVRDIWQMRALLEPYAAGLSASLHLDKELDALESKIESLFTTTYVFDTYIETDVELHQVLCEHVPNRILKETIQRIHQLSMRVRYYPERMDRVPATVVEEVSNEHLAIIVALRAHDVDAASEAMRRHIRNGETRALRALDRRGEE